jgi:hypothetical protein
MGDFFTYVIVAVIISWVAIWFSMLPRKKRQ